MSTQAVSGLSIYQELQSYNQNRQTDLQTLGNALQSGDLSTAQQAYNQLASLGQGGPFANQEPFSRADRAQDFEAIGQALSSGNLAGAQTAFAQLQQTFTQKNEPTAPNLPVDQVNVNNGIGGSGSTSTSSSSSSAPESIYQQLESFRTARTGDLQQLGQALTAGDLNTAQQAYNSLVQLGQQGPFSNAEPFERSDRAQDFEAIGQALQSGDLATAQQDFATLEATFGQNIQQSTLPPVTLPGSNSSTGSSTATLSEIVINIGGSGSGTQQSSNGSELVLNLPAPSNTPEEVQINLGGSNNSADQLTIQVGQTQSQSGAEEEQVTINLPQTSNQSIVLNLFGAGSNASSQTQGSALNVQG